MRVLFASQDGYDTHADQAEAHGNLLGELAEALAAFRKDLAAQKLADQVRRDGLQRVRPPGRRERQPGDRPRGRLEPVPGRPEGQGGLAGRYPSLAKLGDGDLVYNTDFRSVYATLLDRWLGCPAEKALGQSFPTLDLIKAGT